MDRAAMYVDGFNLYHALKGNARTARALWLDLFGLGRALLTKEVELSSVVYFTALTHWNRGKMQRHQTFLDALAESGVEIVKGRFGPTTKECGRCGRVYETHEEKETDVNIATRLIRDALDDKFDIAFLLTGDADQVPTVRLVRDLKSDKKVVAVFPPQRTSNALKSVAHRHVQLSWRHIVRNQFPEYIELTNGRTVQCPPSWRAHTAAPLPPSVGDIQAGPPSASRETQT